MTSELCVKNINIYGNTDYGQPIFPNFSDYRTSSSRGLRHMQNPPHEPVRLRNCPITKARSRCTTNGKEICDMKIDFNKKSTCQNEYTKSGVSKIIRQEIGPRASNIHYMRRLEEHLFNDPPRPLANLATENQNQYKYNMPSKKLPYVSSINSLNLKSEKADPSFYFRSYQQSYSRFLDPYSSTTELTYIPYTKDAQNGIAKKDIITFYDVLDLPKGPRGHGPKISTHFRPNTYDPVQDKIIFKNKCYQRVVPFSKTRVPNSGITTEVRNNYKGQNAMAFDTGICDASPVHQSRWQDLSPPNMYCTEYFHISHKTPVDCVVNVYTKH